jgi:hypothetical protein
MKQLLVKSKIELAQRSKAQAQLVANPTRVSVHPHPESNQLCLTGRGVPAMGLVEIGSAYRFAP